MAHGEGTQNDPTFEHLPRVNQPRSDAGGCGAWPWWYWWAFARPQCCCCCCCCGKEGSGTGAAPLSVSLGLGTIPTVGVPIYYLFTWVGSDGLVELAWTVSGGADPITTELSVISGPAPH